MKSVLLLSAVLFFSVVSFAQMQVEVEFTHVDTLEMHVDMPGQLRHLSGSHNWESQLGLENYFLKVYERKKWEGLSNEDVFNFLDMTLFKGLAKDNAKFKKGKVAFAYHEKENEEHLTKGKVYFTEDQVYVLFASYLKTPTEVCQEFLDHTLVAK